MRVAALGLADLLDVVLSIEDHPEAGPHHGLVVHQQDPDGHAGSIGATGEGCAHAEPDLRTWPAMVDTGGGEGAVGGGIGVSTSDEDRGTKVHVCGSTTSTHTWRRPPPFGGSELVPPMDLPGGYGQLAVLADPDGNPVGLWV